MSSLKVCGMVITETGDVENVYYTCYETGNYELFYNNDPYGIVSIFGLNGLSIKPLEMIASTGSGEVPTNVLEHYNYIYSALTSKIRGDAVAIIYLKDGLLLIKSLYPFEAVKQPYKLGTKENENYSGYVDVSDVDDTSEDYNELIDIMC